MRERVLREIASVYEGNIFFGEDLMEVPLDGPRTAKRKANAADSPPVNAALVRQVLLTPKSWLVIATLRDPPGPVEDWENTSEVKIIDEDGKLKLDIHHRLFGQFSSDVKLNDDGFEYEATHAGKASVHYHPEDKKYQFKGSAANNATIVWSAVA